MNWRLTEWEAGIDWENRKMDIQPCPCPPSFNWTCLGLTGILLAAMVVVAGLVSVCRGDPLDTSGWRASVTVSTCQATVHPAVGRIHSDVLGRSRTYGSGTLIHKEAERGIVITCSHLFRDGMDSVTVTFPDGKRYVAELLKTDKAWDLAALLIAPPDAAPVAIATDHPKQDDPLTFCGYGSDGNYICGQGRALGYARTTLTRTYETLEMTGHARDGDSGGPMFNASGELVAVLWGTDGRMVGGTYCGRIRKFLTGICGPRPGPGANQGGGALCPRCGNPNCVNSQRQQPNCPPGGCLPGGGNQPIPGAIPIPIPNQPGPQGNAGLQGDQGPQGLQGLQGQQGIQGEQGPSLNLDAVVEGLLARLKTDQVFLVEIARLVKVPPIDPVTLAEEIQPHLDPIHVKVSVLDKPPINPQLEQDVYLGGTLPLRLFPVPPKPK